MPDWPGLRRFLTKPMASSLAMWPLLLLPAMAEPARAQNQIQNQNQNRIQNQNQGRNQGGEPLLLEVYVNGYATGKIGEFILRSVPGPIDGHGPEPAKELLVRRRELSELGFRQPGSQRLFDPDGNGPGELVALSEIAGLTLRLDQTTQTLYLTVPIERLIPTELQAGGELAPGSPVRVESGTGATLNYDVTSTYSRGLKSLSGALDLRAFAPRGVLSSGVLGYVSSSAGGGALTNSLVRLDSAYTYGDVAKLRRYTVGDFITDGLGWTRPVRLEGVQARSDFNLRPDLITFPLPTVSGSVAVPSAVDVLTNGSLAISRQIDPGPFEIPELPVVSGAGTISMTVTNALGQQVRIAQPFYASAALLRPGLEDDSVQLGLVRLNWGVASDEYGKLAASGTYRRGMTPKFTVEAAAEATAGLLMAGTGGLLQAGNVGVLNFAAAGSGGAVGRGAQVSVGAQRLGRLLSAGASAIVATSGFQDVAARNGEGVPRRQISANLSFSLRRLGSLGVFYAGLDRASSTSQVTRIVTPSQQTQVFSASYSRSFRRLAVFVNAFEDFASGGAPGVEVGVTMPLGPRESAQLSVSSAGTGQVQIQRSATEIGEWGYQAYASAGVGVHEFAESQYKSRWGLLTAGFDSMGGTDTARLEMQGAVSAIDGGVFPSNTIYDSFAIVDTGAMAGVHVLRENREVGATGATGRLLVPDLRSYELNLLAIVPTDVGLDTTIEQTARQVKPGDRSGVVVRFEVTISHAALLQLVDEDGVAVPVGSTARLRGSRDLVPVGYDGDAYVENLKPRNEVEVLWPDGHTCIAAFSYKPVLGEIPKIGPLRCLTQLPKPETRPEGKSNASPDASPGPEP